MSHCPASTLWSEENISTKIFPFPMAFYKVITKTLPNIPIVQRWHFCQESYDVLTRSNLTKYWTSLIGV